LEKKVLVLGLEGSGKSTLVSQIVKEVGQKSITSNTLYKPTEGFNVTSLSDGGSPTVNIWESMYIFYLLVYNSLSLEINIQI
jgi:predicted kinase